MRKPLGLKCSMGRLGRLASRANECRGGSSIAGEVAKRGEIENVEPWSEMRDGAPSTDSALETSDTEGEGSGASVCGRDAYEEDMMDCGRFSVGLAKDSGCDRSSKLLEQ